MARLILMIGLPGSGKTTFAQRLVQHQPAGFVVSTDAIRATLFGDEATQGPWLKVWAELTCQLHQTLQQLEGLSAPRGIAVYDATNVVRRHRREAIALARSVGFTHLHGLWVDTPAAICLERNRGRSRQVPDEAMQHMIRCLEGAPPHLQDGFDGLVRYDTNPNKCGNCDRNSLFNRTTPPLDS